MAEPSAPERAPRARRWRPFVVLVAAVGGLHALLLSLLPPGVGDGARVEPRRTLRVRQIVVPTPLAEAVAAEAPAPAPAPRPRPEPTRSPAPTEAPREPGATPVAAPAAPVPGAEAAASAPPVYPTRLPPPALLRYEVRRGVLKGSGELSWRPDAGRYEMALQASALALPLIQWSSVGAIDVDGVAPERFVDRRRGRGAQAANFQRAARRITYSGPQVEYALVGGAQDRLSWMAQLPAIVAADPGAFGPGARISMFVTGARGDGFVWTFQVEAVEVLDLPAGTVAQALRLRREPPQPYDMQVEVWLDPARAWLPVRLRLATPPAVDATDFALTAYLPQ